MVCKCGSPDCVHRLMELKPSNHKPVPAWVIFVSRNVRRISNDRIYLAAKNAYITDKFIRSAANVYVYPEDKDNSIRVEVHGIDKTKNCTHTMRFFIGNASNFVIMKDVREIASTIEAFGKKINAVEFHRVGKNKNKNEIKTDTQRR
eukprot:GHVU01187004.1.p1 GENE.GHVU01187004.1~~GHVU01187004.1.p1  ORF type:complete len:147 (-),score=10.49 GHVU01187004.1:101-541(-)